MKALRAFGYLAAAGVGFLAVVAPALPDIGLFLALATALWFTRRRKIT